MVLKLPFDKSVRMTRFYSSVILNGTETKVVVIRATSSFYSSVILNGTETQLPVSSRATGFYSSVILNGTETIFQ